MHAATYHATDHKTFVLRQEFILEDKNEAEGSPYKVNITIDWEGGTRSMLLIMPSHKFLAWSAQVKSFIARKSANADNL